jgi:predicted GIY-YIG superfamily endonuclease
MVNLYTAHQGSDARTVIAGLVLTIPIRKTRSVRQYYVYVLASRPGGAIDVGVTNDLVRHIYEHKNGLVRGFTKRYGIDRLIYFEVYDTAYNATKGRKISSTGHARGKPGSSRSQILRGVISMRRSCTSRIGIAGTNPAMTADRVAQVTPTATRPS